MRSVRYFRDAIANSVSLSPEFVRQVLGNPKCTIEQAAYSALALEEERQDTLRDDLMRKRRELKQQLSRVEDALEELRILRTKT